MAERVRGGGRRGCVGGRSALVHAGSYVDRELRAAVTLYREREREREGEREREREREREAETKGEQENEVSLTY